MSITGMSYTRNLKQARGKVVRARGLLFDMNNTLLNIDKIDWISFKMPFEEKFNVSISYEDYLKFAGSKRARITKELLVYKNIAEDKESISEALVKELVNRGIEVKKQYIFNTDLASNLVLLPGVKEFLIWAKAQNKLMAVVTSTTKEFTMQELNVAGIIHFFDIVLTAEQFKFGKPHSYPYLLAMEKLGLAVQESVAFEDSNPGIISAKASGAFTIGVLTPGINNQAVKKADAVITDYRQIM